MAVPLSPLRHPQAQSAPQHAHQPALFRYTDLELHNTFRLLKLHAGQGETINCSLFHHTLGTSPSYRAVSYTWDSDVARFPIHFPNGSVIHVRENLNAALLSLRDVDSDCWLWIDAICINQDSNDERNHQVRLMADIYGNANIVVAWLQSAGQAVNVAGAFKFVRAAAAHIRSGHHRSIARSRDNHLDWHAMQNLCGLRYWTRKWIIQELVAAPTVVLRTANSTCSMADFETVCRQLHQLNEQDTSRRLIRTVRRIVESPAAVIALQRSEPRDEQQGRLLHELIERYANSQCGLECDHVYALYNLVGGHRTHLPIDYSASSMQRFRAVLEFVRIHEGIEPSKMLDFANLLARLFQLRNEDFLHDYRLSENCNLVVGATLLGTGQKQPETEVAMALRTQVKPLLPLPRISLYFREDVWALMENLVFRDPPEAVGRHDMVYFTIADSGFHGLAACGREWGDAVWYFPSTQLVFVVQRTVQRTHILGRTYLFSDTGSSGALEPWLGWSSDDDSVRHETVPVSMNLTTLVELGLLKLDSFEVPSTFKEDAVEMGEEVATKTKFRRQWRGFCPYGVTIGGSFVVIGIMIAVIVIDARHR